MRVYLRTFGCRANHYDSEAVAAMIRAAGSEIVTAPELADVAVFNSCAVTASAEADLRQAVRQVARTSPRVRSVVMGCAAALDGGTDGPTAPGIRSLPTVEHVVGGADLDAVARALDLPPWAARSSTSRQGGARALLRVQDGCDEHCTFCATTLARGANRSREADEIVREARALAEHHPEIVITGVHIGGYGADLGSSLSALVARLVTEIPHVRFRLSSLEATEVDDRLLELFDEPERLVPHLHAPLQSGSDCVLKRMGRHWYTARSYARAVERICDGRSVFALGADVIAGFPGETESDHAETLALVADLPFTYLHVFPYSARPGTASERLRGPVRADVARGRAGALRAAGASVARAYRARRLGGECDVVVQGAPDERAQREGMTEDFLSVALPDSSLPRGARLRARLVGDAAQLLAAPLPPIIR